VKGEEVANLIRQAGSRAVSEDRCDKPADVKALVERAVAEFGRLDVAFNNAGMDGSEALHEMDIDKAGMLFDVNIKACLLHEIRRSSRCSRRAAGQW